MFNGHRETLDVLLAVDPARPILLAGPTGSGKSGLALAVAEARGGVIVNADALQVYGCWRVLTARPDADAVARAPHVLYGHVAAGAPYSAGHWLREVAAFLGGPERPIIVGGTGLAFAALTEGFAAVPPVPGAIRAEADARLAAGGIAALRDEIDAVTLAGIDAANPARVQRAWEVQRATGRGLADWQAETPPPLLPPGETAAFKLVPGRRWLGDRIDARLGAMLAEGVLEEVRRASVPPGAPAARAIGAAEFAAHLAGQLTLGEALAAAGTATRRYAKRQRTWARSRMGHWRALDPSDGAA